MRGFGMLLACECYSNSVSLGAPTDEGEKVTMQKASMYGILNKT